ncbi:MAG: RNA-binding S4 domain-containing protein [Oscillospiraceae bacterium]
MKVIVKRKEPQSKQVPISTEFIRLEALLKLADAVPSGGMAKNLIQDGQVLVNGEGLHHAGKKAKARGYRLLPGRHLCGNSP